ncbi:hypothetical protein [Engelhardtia mirabilis]|uniref:Uncharacterized protein n=1 Tax=Engelhardtia mirabilis TaxID=2528011 RepID=A0A518BN29_9BACT|nr:hypothetical protein Pla133_34520 [Planctomycetes bacterium Pla133]QDV02682.1 hypothetical protein Pla86_34510 [Planctomycetes bacterium Pla86]
MLRIATSLLLSTLLTAPACAASAADGPAAPAAGAAPGPAASATDLEYLSDFFCFAGGDEKGRVVFAFDANRGRKGTEEQAEYFAVLWVEGDGWRKLSGTGDLAGTDVSYESIPSTASFAVTGTALAGITVASPPNGLELVAQPIEIRRSSEDAGARFDTGSSRASLTLGERRFEGRVSYEFCHLPDKNPLVKTYTDLFGDGYHGVYAFVGEAATADDLRFHRSGGTLRPLVGRFAGFATRGAQTLAVTGEPAFKISNLSLGGFFRWPGRYRASWNVPAAENASPTAVAFDVRLKDRETLVNYVFGGVAVAIVDGSVTRDGVEQPAFGLALIVR